MTDTPKITAAAIQAHVDFNDQIEAFLAPLAREIHAAKRKVTGQDPYDTVMKGVLDKWELCSDGFSVTFYITGSYSYQDWETVSFPVSWIDSDHWQAELAAEADAYQKKEAQKTKEAAAKREAVERADLAKLLAKYGDA